MIEIISLSLSVRPRLVVFDFDGTLSLVRSGWQAVMRDLMVETLLRTPRREAPAELERAAGAFIARSTGQPTLDQLAWLADEVERRGGAAAGAEEYKRRFAARLSEQIERRLDDL
ncbi:MAG TPA: hypothetical protein VF897_21755, partial [Roseiflexaceae bacterium]